MAYLVHGRVCFLFHIWADGDSAELPVQAAYIYRKKLNGISRCLCVCVPCVEGTENGRVQAGVKDGV